MTLEDFVSNRSIVHAESVKGIGVGIYWDQTCLNKTQSLNWGTIAAGSFNNLTVYVRNEGNSEVILSLGTSDWTPSSASSDIYINWNYTDNVLGTYEVTPVKLTLTVSPTIDGTTDFNFITSITARNVY